MSYLLNVTYSRILEEEAQTEASQYKILFVCLYIKKKVSLKIIYFMFWNRYDFSLFL